MKFYRLRQAWMVSSWGFWRYSPASLLQISLLLIRQKSLLTRFLDTSIMIRNGCLEDFLVKVDNNPILQRIDRLNYGTRMLICKVAKNPQNQYLKLTQQIKYLLLKNISHYSTMKTSLQKILESIPQMTVHAGPKDAKWPDRLKQQFKALIELVKLNKANDNDWVQIKCNKEGTDWNGTCTYVHNLVKYTFKLHFEIPASYPSANIELELPELEGKTIKMYRGGKICQDIHFAPKWKQNIPKLGIAHALLMALGPWLAAEVPNMIAEGTLKPK